MLVRQRSMLSRFTFDAFDEHGRLRAVVSWPSVSQARNARLQWHKAPSRAGEVAIRCDGRTFRIGHEYLSRGFNNDVRYILDGPCGRPDGEGDDLADGPQQVLAMAERHVAPGGPARQGLVLHAPFRGTFVRISGMPRIRWEIRDEAGRIGAVAERSWLMLKRDLTVELPGELALPVQLFFFFLATQMSYGTG